MARLVITNTDGDLFVQLEWVDNAGGHSLRATEDLPDVIYQAALDLVNWADNEEQTTYAPSAEKYSTLQALRQEIGRLQAKEKVLIARG